MNYSYLGQQIENVFHFEGDVPFIASALATLGDEMKTAWESTMRAHIQTGCNLNYILLTALDTDAGDQVNVPVDEAGTLSGTGLPGNVTVSIKFGSGVSGRSNRGRMYWPGISTSQVSGNQLLDSVASAFVSDVSDFFDAITTATGYIHVITSYCHNKVWRTAAVNNEVISYLLVDKNLDSQRRRLAGRGI